MVCVMSVFARRGGAYVGTIGDLKLYFSYSPMCGVSYPVKN